MLHFIRRVRNRIRYRHFDRELAEELRVHEEMKREALEEDGLGAEDARITARRALGNVALAREDARGVWIAPWLESVAQDVRYACRALLRQPVYAATAGAALVLGIGLNTALFSVFKGVALDPWPVRNPREVVRISTMGESRFVAPSIDEFRFMRDNARSFSGLVAHTWAGNGIHLRAAGRPEQYLRAVWVTSNFFDVLGVRMQLGRGLVREDDEPGNRRAPLVISTATWKSYFGADPAIVGQPVFVAGVPFTVIGVLEPRFDGIGRPVELWMPLSSLSAVRPYDAVAWEPSPKSAMCCIGVAGRLAPGVQRTEAVAELQRLHEQYAAHTRGKTGRVDANGTAPVSGRGAARFALIGIFAAAVALVLLLACANVGNLQLARGLARRREIAARLAIGASRARVVRQLFTEALVLASAAGVGALGLAAFLPGIVFRFVGEELPPRMEARMVPDAGVALFTFVTCLVACVAFALAPAFSATRVTIPLGALDRASTTTGRFRLRGVLLAVQIAACTVLLVAAGLVTRAIGHAMTIDPGFRVREVTLVSARLPTDSYTTTQRHEFYTGVLAAVDGGKGPAVALAGYAPFDGSRLMMNMALAHERLSDGRSVDLRQVSGRYFEVLGIPLIAGRSYALRARDEAVVNESFARTYFPGQNPVGHVVRDVGDGTKVRATFTIVGVAKDVFLAELDRIEPTIFTPASAGLFVTAGGPATAERIRAAALASNPVAGVTIRPLTDALSDALEDSRVGAALAWAIGLVGLALAIVGVFGVFAYAVEERRREIGVRMALGADRREIVRMLIATSGRSMTMGLGAGLVLSLACGPVLRSYLFGLSAVDPRAYALVGAILAAAAILATIVPARRACRVDPAVTLRAE
jgi:predicted permease